MQIVACIGYGFVTVYFQELLPGLSVFAEYKKRYWGRRFPLYVLGLCLTPPRRRMELALYCLPRALESFYREMVAEGKLPVYVLLSLSLFLFFSPFACSYAFTCPLNSKMHLPPCSVKHWDTLVFCLAAAGIVYCYELHNNSISPAMRAFVTWLWGPPNDKVSVDLLMSFARFGT